MDVLLTNDDGIDAAGLGVLYRTLDAMDDVTVTAVAPVDDQSAVGRALNHEVDIQTHEYGYAVDGTPTDCVVAALGALGIDPDIVVSGCNRGANLGEYVPSRCTSLSRRTSSSRRPRRPRAPTRSPPTRPSTSSPTVSTRASSNTPITST